ncbi:MAG: tyrosine-type recombinase/integrase [Thermoleophilia bacterium]
MAKRGAGEGNYRKRSDGRWEGRLSIVGKQRSFYAKTLRECQQKLNEARHKAEQGLPISDERLTVGMYLDDWLELVQVSLRPSTFRSYQDLIRIHIKPEIGKVKMAKLSPQQIQSLLNKKLKGGLSPRRCEYIYAVLHRALGQGERLELISRNPARLVCPPRPKKKAAKFLSIDEAQSLLRAAEGDRMEVLLLVALSTGLRRGELLGLRWEDIDLVGGTLKVRHSLQRGGILAEPKSAAGLRTIVLPNVTKKALKRHRKRQVQDRLLAGSRWQERGFVFTSIIGTPLCGDNVYKRYRGLLEKAGLPGIPFHSLRHTACSFLAAQGVHPAIAMDVMGHSQVSLTLNVYSHAAIEGKREAAIKMGELFRTENASIESS